MAKKKRVTKRVSKKRCSLDKRVKNLDVCHLQFVKLAVAAFTLMVAKLWPPLLSLDWYWYLLIAIVAASFPFKKVWLALVR